MRARFWPLSDGRPSFVNAARARRHRSPNRVAHKTRFQTNLTPTAFPTLVSTPSAGVMLSSKPPPYLPALVLEARESAGKIEVGLWQKASGGGDYVTRARKKMETIATQIQRSGTPVQVQGAHYQAAMAAQQLAQQQAAAQRHSQSQTAAAAAQTGNPENEQLAATLDLFDRKLQSGGGSHPPQLQSERPASGHAQNHQAQSSTLTLVQNSAQPPVNDPHMNRLVQLVVKKYVDRPEFKTYLSGLPNAEQRQCLVKSTCCANPKSRRLFTAPGRVHYS